MTTETHHDDEGRDRDRGRAVEAATDGGPTEVEAGRDERDERDEREPRVLIVDDEPNVARAYALWLGEGYETTTATDGEAALAAVDDGVDVVLLDRRMPGMSGDEVLEAIRARGVDCRVAMVTAVDPDFDVVDMAFDDYLVKPVDRDDLVAAIERLVGLAAYDDTFEEYFRVARKVASLEAGRTRQELDRSEEYAVLESRLATLREELDDQFAGGGPEDFAAVLGDPGAGAGGGGGGGGGGETGAEADDRDG